MREVYYAIYRSATLEVALNVCLAEAARGGYATLRGERVSVSGNAPISEAEKDVLRNIRFGRQCNIRLKQIAALGEELIGECRRNGWIWKIPILGLRKTGYFRAAVQEGLHGRFDARIVQYVDTVDAVHLKPIIPKIDQIEYPPFREMQSSRVGPYRDRDAALRDGVLKAYGIFR